MKFNFIDQEKGELPVPAMCKHLRVSESGFYRWKGRQGQPDRRKRDNETALRAVLSKLHRASRGRYGRPRLHILLKERGFAVGADRLARIMREMGISGRGGPKPRRRIEGRHAKTPAAPNLLGRDFSVSTPNTVWTSDITELCAGQARARMAIVLDLHGRVIAGWKLDPQMKTELVIGALKRAVRTRKPNRGLIFHSDQGVQYTSFRLRQMLSVLGMRQSMSRRANCWDNAPTESFFATLKKELVYTRSWSSVAELERAIARYIRFYNRDRIHTSLGQRSPRDYEDHHAA